jgi:hypothetical protein
MDFGSTAQIVWIVIVVAVIGAIWYGKRNPPPPETK